MTTTAPTTTPTDRLARIYDLYDLLYPSPWGWDLLELAMATAITQRLAGADALAPVWLLFYGPSSTGKTATVRLLRDVPDVKTLSTVNPDAFLSEARDDKTKKRARSLLPELHGKCVVWTELGALLSDDPRKVTKTLGALTAIFDGHYSKAVGNSFDASAILESDSRFSVVACVKPDVLHDHHRHMAVLGSRFLGYRVPGRKPHSSHTAMTPDDHAVVATKLRADIRAHLIELPTTAHVVLSDAHDFALRWMARLVACGRTPRIGVAYINGQGFRRYAPTLGTTEEPHRLYEQLSALVRALATLNLRTAVTPHDLDLARRVAVSSVLVERAEVLHVIATRPVTRVAACDITVGGATERITTEWPGTTTGVIASRLRWSPDLAAVRLAEMVEVGLLVKDGAVPSGPGKADFYRPAPEYEGLIVGGFEDSADGPWCDPVDPALIEVTS